MNDRPEAGAGPDFQDMVRRHGRRIFRLAYRMTGNRHDAEDVVQETFLRAVRREEILRPGGEVSPWLNTIATRCSIDLLRRRQRWRTEDLDDAGPSRGLTATGPGPERVLLGVEIHQRIRTAMTRLTDRERIAFTLRHHEGCSIREIARSMELGESATKNHIFRAVRKLRAALTPAVEDER